jgi:hypothetical protein
MIDSNQPIVFGTTWVDPRMPGAAQNVISKHGETLHYRVSTMLPYDACIQWMDAFLGSDLPTDMYYGNGGHYWLAVSDAIFDPRADLVPGFPSLSSESYRAEKIIWRDNERVNQDILSDTQVTSPGTRGIVGKVIQAEAARQSKLLSVGRAVGRSAADIQKIIDAEDPTAPYYRYAGWITERIQDTGAESVLNVRKYLKIYDQAKAVGLLENDDIWNYTSIESLRDTVRPLVRKMKTL